MPAESTFYPRVFALAVAALLGGLLVLIFKPFLAALSWAAFLAFVLYPLNLKLRRRLRGKKRLEYEHQQATQEGGDRQREDAWIKGGFGGHQAIISSPSRAGPSRRAVGRRCPLLKFGRVA